MIKISKSEYLGSLHSHDGYDMHMYSVEVDGESKALKVLDSHSFRSLVFLYQWNKVDQAACMEALRVFESDLVHGPSSITIKGSKGKRYIQYGGKKIMLPNEPKFIG